MAKSDYCACCWPHGLEVMAPIPKDFATTLIYKSFVTLVPLS